jgi:hypothetical protein
MSRIRRAPIVLFNVNGAAALPTTFVSPVMICTRLFLPHTRATKALLISAAVGMSLFL